MSKVKNISGGTLDVPLLGRPVEDGESVDVPDFQPGSTDENPLPIIWPPDKWQPVGGKPKATAPAADDSSGKAAS